MISRLDILSPRRRLSAIHCRRLGPRTCLGLATVLASLFILAFFAFGSLAQEDGEQGDSGISRWKLRRVLVPESKLGEVVRGRYLPLRVDRFNELLEAQRQQTDVSSQWPFESLVLRGELDTQGKLQGEGSLRLSSRTRKREWLVQPMPSLQMDGLNWRDFNGLPARAGTGSEGRWYLEDVGAEQLDFQWSSPAVDIEIAGEETRATDGGNGSVAAIRDYSDPVLYAVEFPGVVHVALLISLAADLEIRSPAAICRPLPDVEQPEELGMRLWRLDFSGAGRHVFSIQRVGSDVERESQVSYIANTTYRVRQGVIEGSTAIEWQATPPDGWEWPLESGWNLLEVRAGGGEVGYQLEPSGGRQTCRIDLGGLPDEIKTLTLKMERVFQFEDTLTLGVPELNGLWTGGALAIELAPGVEVDQWDLKEGQWLANGSEQLGLRRFVAQATGPNCRVDLRARQNQERLSGEVFTEVRAEGQKVAGVVRAWLDRDGTKTLDWRIPLQDGWIVDQVSVVAGDGLEVGDSNGANQLETWDIVQDEDGQASVDLRLKEITDDGSPVTIVIEAHRLTFPNPLDRLPPEDLGVVDLRAAPAVRHWLAVEAAPPFRFYWEPVVGATLEPTSIPDRLSSWKQDHPTTRLHVLESSGAAGFFQLKTELVYRFDADYEVRCRIGDRTVEQAIRMQCRPTESRLNQVRLSWPTPPTSRWNWRLETLGSEQPQSVTSIEERVGVDGGVTTLLQWPEGLDQPFVLVGTTNDVWSERWVPDLPIVSRAQRRTGSITLSSNARESLTCIAEEMQRLPASIARQMPNERLLGVFELAGILDDGTGLDERLWVQKKGAGSFGDHLIWNAELDSWPGIRLTRHRLVMDVTSYGTEPLLLRPADSASLLRLTIDGQIVDLRSYGGELAAEDNSVWRVPLPQVPKRQMVAIDFTTQGSLGFFRKELSAAMPEFFGPTLDSQWRIHVPQGYRIEAKDSGPHRLQPLEGIEWLLFRWSGLSANTEEEQVSSRLATESALDRENANVIEGETIWVEQGASHDSAVSMERTLVSASVYWIALFAAAGVTLIVHRVLRIPPLTICLGVSLAVLWFPTSLVFATTGIVPGCLLAWGISTIRRQQTNGESRPARQDSALRTTRAAVNLGLMVGICAGTIAMFSASGRAQEVTRQDESNDPTEVTRLVDVITPVDDDGLPTLDLVYLPQEFLDELLRSAPRRTSSLPWLIESARHTIDVESNPFSDETRWRLTSRFRIRTLQENSLFTLPYSSDEVFIQADEIQLDQGIARVTGTPDTGLQVRIDEVGSHDLVVSALLLAPAASDQVWTWMPPLVLDSKIRMNGIESGGWQLDAPTDPSHLNELGVDRWALIGPSQRLRFRPRLDAEDTDTNAVGVDVAEVVRLVDDDWRVTLWFANEDDTSLPSGFSFRVDSGWEVMPNAEPANVTLRLSRLGTETLCTVQATGAEDRVDMIGVELRAPLDGQAGRKRLPQLELATPKINKRQVVVVSPSSVNWTYERPANPIASQIRDTLQSIWSDGQIETMSLGNREPMVFEVPARSIEEYIRVEPQQPILAVDQQVDLKLSWSETKYENSAVVSVMRGQVDSIEVLSNLPASLEDVSVSSAGETIDASLLQAADNRYLITFAEPQTSTFQLNFRGGFRRAGVTTAFPTVRISNIADATYQCRISRDPLVKSRVFLSSELDEIDELVEQEVASIEQQLRDDRSASLTVAADSSLDLSSISLTTERVAIPQLAQCVTSYERGAADWQVTIFAQVDEADDWGMEAIDVEVPEGFLPVDSEGSGAWEIKERSSFRDRRRWVASRRIQAGEWFAIEGTLPRFPDDSGLPRIADLTGTQQFLSLPGARPEDPYLWQFSGEQVVDLERFDGSPMDLESGQLVITSSESSPTARVASKPLVVRPTRIYLADYRLHWKSDRAVMVCRFILDPGGRNDLDIRLPRGFRLSAIFIDQERQPLGSLDNPKVRPINRELPQEVVLWCEVGTEEFKEQGWKDQALPGFDLEPEQQILAVMPRPQGMPEFNFSGLAGISRVQWEDYQVEASERVLEIAPTITLMSQQAIQQWVNYWAEGEESNESRSSDWQMTPNQQVGVDGRGEVVWLNPIPELEPVGIKASSEPGTLPDESWKYYQPQNGADTLRLTAKASEGVSLLQRLVFSLLWVGVSCFVLGLRSRLGASSRIVCLFAVMFFIGVLMILLVDSKWGGPVLCGLALIGVLKQVLQARIWYGSSRRRQRSRRDTNSARELESAAR